MNKKDCPMKIANLGYFGRDKAKHEALESKRVIGKGGEGKVAKGNEGKGGKDNRKTITNRFKLV